MAKKKKTEVVEVQPVSTSFVQLMEDGFARYAEEVIKNRALPDIRDGLKPVQRRILYAMYEDGNTANKAYRKSAKTVGNVIGNYHPHGDSSVYEAMVNMSQDWKMGAILIDMQGNNGSIDGDSAAAMRYTESRLSPIANHLLSEIDQDTVDFNLNYSDSQLEPDVLPAAFCNILVNGTMGIAIGFATEIPSFNFNEINKACIYRLNNPNCSDEEIIDIVPGPDFATGGIIEGQEDIHAFLKTGKGRFVMRCVVDIEFGKKINQLVVHEVSYSIKKSDLVKRINDVRINKNIDDILEVRDESDRNGLRVVIDVKTEADAQNILNILYKETELQSYYNPNMTVLVDGSPRVLSLVEILDAYLEFRVEVFKKKTQYQLAKKQNRIEILEGLIRAISHLDEVISIIRKSQNKKDSKANLIERFNFTDAQAEAIVTLQLYRLSNTDIIELKDEFALLLNEIDYLKSVLSNQNILISEIVKEFKYLDENYTFPRKTRVIKDVAEVVIDKEALIAEEEVVVSVSYDGYLKKSTLRSYGASDQYYSSIKQGDRLIGQSNTLNLYSILSFTQSGQYFVIRAHELSDSKWKDIGVHFSSLVNNATQDKIVSTMIVKSFDTDAMITMVSKNGKIKKTSVRDFEVTRQNRLYKAMKLDKKDSLVVAMSTSIQDQEVMLLSETGNIVRYDLEQVSLQGLNASGVKAMNLGVDHIVDGLIVSHKSDLVFLTQDGQAKRLKTNDISVSGRPAKGNLVAKKVKSNPNQLSQMIQGDINDLLPLYTIEKMEKFMKDVSLMNSSQTFSKQFTKDDFLVKDMVFVPIEVSEKKDNPSTKVEQVAFELDQS